MSTSNCSLCSQLEQDIMETTQKVLQYQADTTQQANRLIQYIEEHPHNIDLEELQDMRTELDAIRTLYHFYSNELFFYTRTLRLHQYYSNH